jgi:hypothetical protein
MKIKIKLFSLIFVFSTVNRCQCQLSQRAMPVKPCCNWQAVESTMPYLNHLLPVGIPPGNLRRIVRLGKVRLG